jgi:hypothetical protein
VLLVMVFRSPGGSVFCFIFDFFSVKKLKEPDLIGNFIIPNGIVEITFKLCQNLTATD